MQSPRLTKQDVQPALDFIAAHWKGLIRTTPEDRGTLIGLPHPYVVPAADPNASFQFEEQYYWDSFFTVLGLKSPEHQSLAEGMLENLLHLRRRFGMIPNASRMYFTSRSQPPVLTSYIWHIYRTYDKSVEWLSQHMAEAEIEYRDVWMSKQHPNWHYEQGLNRYYDINSLHDLAEAESGWDMTTRFDRKCLDFWPIDLNSLLFKYEIDFAKTAALVGDKKTEKKWRDIATERRSKIDAKLWSGTKGFYFDYNFNKKTRGTVWSLAAYFAMWAGLASEEQAQRLVANLSKLEHVGGLSTTARPLLDMSLFGSVATQWAYPNGWAPLHYIVIEGLERYGYSDDARRIALKWLKTNNDWFNRHHEFLEKYNVVKPHKHPVEGVYPSQTGFGWTNGVFVQLVDTYV